MEIRTAKETGLVVLATLLSMALFFSYVSFAGTQIISMIILSSITILWIAIIATALILVTNKKISITLIILSVIIVAIAGRFTASSLVGASFLLIALLSTRKRYNKDLNSHIKYNTVDIFLPGTKILIIGIIAVLVSLSVPITQEIIQQKSFLVNEKHMSLLLKPLQPIIDKMVPGFDSQGSIDDLIDARLKQELSGLPEGVTISDEQRQQIKAQLSRQLQQKVTGKESLASIATKFINDKIELIVPKNDFFISVIIVILVFFSLRALTPLIIWPAIWLISLFIFIMRKAGMVQIVEEQSTIERLMLL